MHLTGAVVQPRFTLSYFLLNFTWNIEITGRNFRFATNITVEVSQSYLLTANNKLCSISAPQGFGQIGRAKTEGSQAWYQIERHKRLYK